MTNELNEMNLNEVTGGAGTTTKKAKIINCDAVNIRNATSGGDVIGKIPCGKIVTFHGRYGNWGLVTYNGIKGYIYRDYFQVL